MGRVYGHDGTFNPACLFRPVGALEFRKCTCENVIRFAVCGQPLYQLDLQPSVDLATELDQVVVKLSHDGKQLRLACCERQRKKC